MSQDVVKVSELKNRLSHYLREVRRGRSLLVCDRDQVIARIEPAGSGTTTAADDAHWLADLERRGTIRRAVTPLPKGWHARRPKVRADVVGSLLAEREEGALRFWDSSALVPLVIAQPASQTVDSWLEADPARAVWTLTPVEISSALQRLLRDGAIAEGIADQAEQRTAELIESCHIIIDVQEVKRQAQRLLRLHPLRAADALQLGAAIERCAGRPAGRILHTLDARLASAGRREGFGVPAP